MRKLILIFILGIYCCDSCEFVPQSHFLGLHEVEMNVNDTTLHIGEPLHFIFEYPKEQIDLIGTPLNIDKGIEVFIKVTTTAHPADTTTNLQEDFFSTEKTIFEEFDEYFDVNLLRGEKINHYSYYAELVNDMWVLEIIYIPKREACYWARIQIKEILSTDTEVADNQCMEGPDHFGAKAKWKLSDKNRIDYLFSATLDEYPDYFGFIVE